MQCILVDLTTLSIFNIKIWFKFPREPERPECIAITKTFI